MQLEYTYTLEVPSLGKNISNDELMVSQIPDAPTKQIDVQNQYLGPCDSEFKTEIMYRCNIDGVICISLSCPSYASKHLVIC